MADYSKTINFIKELYGNQEFTPLSVPVFAGNEKKYLEECIDTTFVSSVGKFVDRFEEEVAKYTGAKKAVVCVSGTNALHMSLLLSGVERDDEVLTQALTFIATCNALSYIGAHPVFVDVDRSTMGLSPDAVKQWLVKNAEIRNGECFNKNTGRRVKACVPMHTFGHPVRIEELAGVCEEYHIELVEDAAESIGSRYKGKHTGTFGKVGAISFNGNKIITGSSGGMFLTESLADAEKVRKWSTQSREAASWYQHEEIGYNYRMSNVIAGVVRGQIPYLEEHISQKKAIFERYKEGFKDLPVKMNPFDAENSEPNYWLSCIIIDKEAMCRQVRSDSEALYISEDGKSCPTEILEAISALNAEGRPVWKPMHSQPIFRRNDFITALGSGRAKTNAYIDGNFSDVGTDIFERGLCLPSDNKMTPEQQDVIIAVIRNCFGK